MICDCPKCREPFELSSQCFQAEGRLTAMEFIACPLCGHLYPALDLTGDERWGEFLSWINDYNASLIPKNDNRKVWEVIVYDRGLRDQLIDEAELPFSAGDPSLRFLLRCKKPDEIFILKKFREYTMKEYRHGFIDPTINIHLAARVMDHEAVIDA